MSIRSSSTAAFAICASLAVLLLGFGAWRYSETSATNSWPSVQGTIDSSTITTIQGGRRNNSPPKNTYRVDFTYEYRVGAAAHSGSHSGLVHLTQGSAEQELARRRVGQAIKVHYNPRDPAESVLTPGVTISVWLTLLAGLCFLALTVRFWIRS